MSKDCRAWRNGSNKKFEKTEKAFDGDELVLCSLTRDNKKQVGVQNQAKWHVPGMPSCMWVQSGTRC